jgi:PAS domain S-box-containing protein
MLLADAASQRMEVEALLECGEVPPELESMSRQMVVLHRVSEQRTAKLEEMLRELTMRFDEITANFPGVIYRRTVETDGSFRYIYVSPSSQKYFGVDAEDMLADANMLFRNFHPDDVARIRHIIRSRQSRASGAVLTQYRVTGSDGIQRWMQGLSEPHVSVSGELVWEGVAVDISALKAAEARELELRQSEQQARRKADAENEAKSRFLAVMSHEIRNPLNSIAGYARLLQEQAGEQSEIRQFAHVIEQASGHLALIVNDVLDFSKIEAGRVVVEKSVFSLADVASFLKGQMAVLADGKDVGFDVVNDAATHQVVGDRMRLTQILMNLLTNAFKFTSKGRVVLSMAQSGRTEREMTVRFKVTDTGIGMDADALSRIFQPFEQADASSSRRFGGTGLGLAISQKLAKLMHSEIHVTSHVGEGSVFWFDLQFAIESRSTVRRPGGRLAPPIASGGLKVLIVDDNEVNSRLLAAMLGARSYECSTVSSGEAALAALEENTYGVMLLDIDMPQMDGYEVAARIRKSSFAPVRDMRIVAITGNAFAEDVERALASGIDDHLAKPTDFDALFRLLREEEVARGIGRKTGVMA